MPFCGNNMKYVYGEMYECPGCGRKEPTDFGKVRDFLDTNGPQPAIVIADATGVSLDVIDGFLNRGELRYLMAQTYILSVRDVELI